MKKTTAKRLGLLALRRGFHQVYYNGWHHGLTLGRVLAFGSVVFWFAAMLGLGLALLLGGG